MDGVGERKGREEKGRWGREEGGVCWSLSGNFFPGLTVATEKIYKGGRGEGTGDRIDLEARGSLVWGSDLLYNSGQVTSGFLRMKCHVLCGGLLGMPGAEKGLEGSQHWSLKLDKNNSQDLTWNSDSPRNPCTLEKGIYMQTYKLSSPFCLARALSLPSSWAVAGAWPSSHPASNPEAILLPTGSGHSLSLFLNPGWALALRLGGGRVSKLGTAQLSLDKTTLGLLFSAPVRKTSVLFTVYLCHGRQIFLGFL